MSPLEISFDGRPIPVTPGRTIGAALLAAGITSWPAPARPATTRRPPRASAEAGRATPEPAQAAPAPGPALAEDEAGPAQAAPGPTGPVAAPGRAGPSPAEAPSGRSCSALAGDSPDPARAALFCGIGVCFGCLVTVNGRAGVRACLVEAHAGDAVTSGGSAA